MTKPLLIIGNRNYSSWSFRAWLILAKAKMDFEVLRIPLFSPGFEVEIRKYSPAGKVPIYVEGDLSIWDTLAIAEYCAERDPALWPSARSTRAVARAATAEMHSGFHPLRQGLPMNCRAMGRRANLTPEVVADIARIQGLITECRNTHATKGPWLFGAFSIADAFYAPVMSRFLTYGIKCESVVERYLNGVMQDEKVREWHAAARTESEIIEEGEVDYR